MSGKGVSPGSGGYRPTRPDDRRHVETFMGRIALDFKGVNANWVIEHLAQILELHSPYWDDKCARPKMRCRVERRAWPCETATIASRGLAVPWNKLNPQGVPTEHYNALKRKVKDGEL